MFEITWEDSEVCIRAEGTRKYYNVANLPDWQHRAQVWACNHGAYRAADEFRALIGAGVGGFTHSLPADTFMQGEESPPILSDADLVKALESCYALGRRHFFDRLRGLIDSRE